MSRTVDFSYIIGASVSEPLSSDVYVDFVCHGPSSGIAKAHASHFFCTWTVRHGNGACVSFFFAGGSVCYYGYCISSVLISEVLRKLEVSICDPSIF